ncbi:acyltransferase domain-containing protein [Cryptosporangium minutisporangium]|uniref:[acyl-carrier-protein] S-malonyltransferase n=1 Tax=Cryptosporangium minutisporangium TaxID=113569 RepID=A0ABP6SXS9_9ACTN
MLALLAPGQGSQKPGFLTPWLTGWDGADRATALLRWYSTVAGLDLVHLGTEADADEIRDTAKTQPLLVAAGLMVGSFLPTTEATVVAGHSIGELTAAPLAGVLTPEAAVALAAVRGREMAAACALEPTGMSAVLGGVEADVLERLDALGLSPANRNGAGQIVAAGPLPALAKLADDPPARARVIALQVAGAFHTPYMGPAQEALASVAGGVATGDPARLLLSNADGTAVLTGAEALARIVRQVTAPVRWDRCQATLLDLGVTAAIELAPAGTLAGLAKRAMKGVQVVTVNTPDDLPAAAALIAEHAAVDGSEPAPTFQVAVAPAAGRFRPAALRAGDVVAPGAAVGEIETRQGPVSVTTRSGGVLAEWAAEADDPVATGQPLARLNPAARSEAAE